MKNFNCPKCGGNTFTVNPEAFAMARGQNVHNLPVKCKGCGFEAKPSDFRKHKKEAPKS